MMGVKCFWDGQCDEITRVIQQRNDLIEAIAFALTQSRGQTGELGPHIPDQGMRQLLQKAIDKAI